MAALDWPATSLTHQLVHSPRSLQFEGGQHPQTQLPGNIDGDQQVATGTDTHPEHQVLGEGKGGEELATLSSYTINYAPYSARMSPENTHRFMGFYMDV